MGIFFAFSLLSAATVAARDKRHSIFDGSTKFVSSNLAATLTPKQDKGSYEWTIPETHLENVGFAKHFEAVKLDDDDTHVFKMGWNSWGRVTPNCKNKKVGGDYMFEYECRDKKTKSLNKDCGGQVSCTRDTGDFRIFLGDSNGHQVKENFGRLSDPKNTGLWRGVEWRIFPHGEKKFDRKKDANPKDKERAMPSHVMTKGSTNSAFEIFSTKTGYRNLVGETCDQYFDGSFGVP